MKCYICCRQHNAQTLPFLCTVDARNQLYERRIAHTVALLENEQLEGSLNAQVENGRNGYVQAGKDMPATRKARLDNRKSEERTAVDRTSQIIALADQLRDDVEAARKEIAERKAAMARRRSDMTALSEGLEARRKRQLDEVEKSIGTTKFRWDRSYDTMAATRGFLCMEAAKLYGLKKVKKGGSYRYEIGGLDIFEPVGMNTAAPEAISTSLAHITHILMLSSHYLALRLPAEITLPHKDNPRPTILSLAASYGQDERSQSQIPTTPPARKDSVQSDKEKMPRSRPLFIDKPLPSLAKEDPIIYTAFTEAVALLAYNIAWACCTQGVPIGDRTSFDDVSNIGRNLYNLLIGHQQYDNPRGRIFGKAGAEATGDGPTAASLMGRNSHGSVHTPLNEEFVRAFRLPSPRALAERLRGKLGSQGSLPEWEVLQEEAWEVDDHMEEGVLVQNGAGTDGRRRETDMRLFGVESVATVQGSPMDETLIDLPRRPAVDGNGEKARTASSGTNGWTKLKNR